MFKLINFKRLIKKFTCYIKREQWEGLNPWYPREEWHQFDPMLLSEGMFGAAMIFR